MGVFIFFSLAIFIFTVGAIYSGVSIHHLRKQGRLKKELLKKQK